MRRAVLIGLCLAIVSGCDFAMFVQGIPGSGVSSTEVRELQDFHAVEFQGGGAMDVVISDGTRCEVTCDDNLLELIGTEVVDGRLKIYCKENISPKVGLTVTLQSKDLNSIQISGSCKANVRQLNTESISLEITGSGTVTMDGRADTVDIQIAGSGNVNSLDLESNSVKVSISGSGDVTSSAETALDVRIAGSGKVRYRGNANVTQSVAGSGSVKRLTEETATGEASW